MFPSTVNKFPGIVVAEESEWKDNIRGSNAVVNLAGTPISTRWSSEVLLLALVHPKMLLFQSPLICKYDMNSYDTMIFLFIMEYLYISSIIKV